MLYFFSGKMDISHRFGYRVNVFIKVVVLAFYYPIWPQTHITKWKDAIKSQNQKQEENIFMRENT